MKRSGLYYFKFSGGGTASITLAKRPYFGVNYFIGGPRLTNHDFGFTARPQQNNTPKCGSAALRSFPPFIIWHNLRPVFLGRKLFSQRIIRGECSLFSAQARSGRVYWVRRGLRLALPLRHELAARAYLNLPPSKGTYLESEALSLWELINGLSLLAIYLATFF